MVESRDKMKKKKLLFELTKAISKVDESTVKITISQGVDLDATIIYSKTPLSYSLEMDAENIAILLLEKGANPEKPATCEKSNHVLQPIHFASKFNQTKFLSALMKKNVDLDVKTSAELCALHYAAYAGHLSICSDLINHGANVNSRDSNSRTPLHRAAENGQTAVINLLVKSGADVCAEDEMGNTPLIIACYLNQTLAAKSLLDMYNNVNSCNKEGNSALHVACSQSIQNSDNFKKTTYGCAIFGRQMFHHNHVFHFEYKLADILVSSGADVEAVNTMGLTPFECARTFVTPETQLALLEKFVSAGLWVSQFSPETYVALDPAFQPQLEEVLSFLRLKQMTLKQQCKRIIRKSILMKEGKSMQCYVGCLPLPMQLQNYLQ